MGKGASLISSFLQNFERGIASAHRLFQGTGKYARAGRRKKQEEDKGGYNGKKAAQDRESRKTEEIEIQPSHSACA